MIEIGLGHYLTLGAIIFTIGVVGIFLSRKNVIVILMSIELILLAKKYNISITELPVNWTHRDNSKLNIFDNCYLFFNYKKIYLCI